MLSIDEMREIKKKHGYTYAALAGLSGIPLGTLQKVLNGSTASPRFATMQALSAFFMYLEDAGGSLSTKSPDENISAKSSAGCHAREAGPDPTPDAPGRQDAPKTGATLTDYYALPGEIRVELIDGAFYDMAAPTITHQELSFLIHRALDDYLREKGGTCKVYSAPVDVRLDLDDDTMVQPDVIVVCDPDKRKDRRRIEGAPDLVVEVLSESTRRKDLTKKLEKYMRAGVREYWAVDPSGRIVAFDWTAGGDPMPRIYGRDAKIPVAIWDGDCVVDFDEIFREIEL